MDTTKLTIAKLVAGLAVARDSLERARDYIRDERMAFEQRPDIQEHNSVAQELSLQVNELTAAIRQAGLLPENAHPALKIKTITSITIHKEAALGWCRTKFPAAIREELDTKMLETYVKNNPEPWADIEQTPTVTIATDLSAWLPK